jgi:hypothetical protein
MKDMMKIAAFLHRVDIVCAGMNTGLSAVAAVLAVVVVSMSVGRASEIAIDPGTTSVSYSAISPDKPILNFWTYD